MISVRFIIKIYKHGKNVIVMAFIKKKNYKIYM